MVLKKYSIIVFIVLCFLGIKNYNTTELRSYSDENLDFLEIDTLFMYPFHAPFDVFNCKSNNCSITFVGIENEVFQFSEHQNLKFKGRANSDFYVEYIFRTKDQIFLGLGTEYKIETLIISDTNILFIDSIQSLNVLSVSKTNKALCFGDYYNNKQKSLKERVQTFQFVYDLKSKDTVIKFRNNYLVTESNDNYFEFDFNNTARDGGGIDVNQYSSKGDIIRTFNIIIKQNKGVPVYFFNDKFYLTYTPKAFYLFNSKGKEIDKYNVSSIFRHKFYISNDNRLYVFGWLDTDKELENYAFVKKIFRLNI